MSDMADLEALFAAWGVPFEKNERDSKPGWTLLLEGESIGPPYHVDPDEKVIGYSGFVTLFHFSPTGEFEQIGIWE